jgi:hypothetical protein
MNKKISYSGLKNVLSPKQMKNVLGGSGGLCPDDFPYIFRCSDDSLRCCKIDDVNKCCA